MRDIHIAWGSQTGNSTNLANVIGDSLNGFGIIHVHDMSEIAPEKILDIEFLKYAVIGLGDTYYPHFCQAGKDFDQYLSQRGANALLPRLDCDLYFEEQYPEWLEELKSVLKNTLPV
jgi:sulfite reductase alpha subunit-like flavoprotein